MSFNQRPRGYGWPRENQYSSSTLMGNWVEEQFDGDGKELGRPKPLPSQVSLTYHIKGCISNDLYHCKNIVCL